jgi:glycosyltransferase involved in cell wall biosynthesis
MLSTDKRIFHEGSAVRERMRWYGTICEELHVVVYTKKSERRGRRSEISGNVFAYATQTQLKPLYFFDSYRIAKNILARRGQWLVTSQDPFETGLLGWALKKRYSLPLQIQVHTDLMNPYFQRESIKNKLRVSLAKFLIPKADCIRVVSERIARSLHSTLNIPRSAITVLPVYIDAEKIRRTRIQTNLHKKYSQYEKIILMASRLTKEKNIPLALHRMREIVKQYTRAGLIIVGDGPEKNNLKIITKNLKLGQSVRFEPWTDELFSYYKTADVFLLTSNYEGYGRTIIEALAAGCPVVSVDVGIAREAGAIIAPQARLGEKILHVFRNGTRGSLQIAVLSENEWENEWRKNLLCAY